VKDNKLIRNISLKDFLSDNHTKEELTKYLAEKKLVTAKVPTAN